MGDSMKNNKRQKIKKEKKVDNDSLTIGMCMGICIGTAVGAATDNLALWLPIGLCLGLSLGSAFLKNKDDSDK